MKCHRHLTWTILSNIKDENAIKWYSPNYFFSVDSWSCNFFLLIWCFWYFETTFDAHQNIETRAIYRWWGIDGFQGERRKDQSSLTKYISGLNKIGCQFTANEWVFLKYLATDEMIADNLTKPFPKHRFKKLIYRS